jgi:hypothetical protein
MLEAQIEQPHLGRDPNRVVAHPHPSPSRLPGRSRVRPRLVIHRCELESSQALSSFPATLV